MYIVESVKQSSRLNLTSDVFEEKRIVVIPSVRDIRAKAKDSKAKIINTTFVFNVGIVQFCSNSPHEFVLLDVNTWNQRVVENAEFIKLVNKCEIVGVRKQTTGYLSSMEYEVHIMQKSEWKLSKYLEYMGSYKSKPDSLVETPEQNGFGFNNVIDNAYFAWNKEDQSVTVKNVRPRLIPSVILYLLEYDGSRIEVDGNYLYVWMTNMIFKFRILDKAFISKLLFK